MTPPITIVMVTRNRRARSIESLRHLVALPSRPEIIVVDNGSSDGTAAAVERAFPQVEVLRLQENMGATARNVGVETATTQLVAFADDDSWWEPGSLSRAIQIFERHPRLGVLAARILVGPAGELDPASQLMARSPLPPRDDLPGPAILGFVACGTVVRRQAFLDVGGFDEVVFFFGEEARVAIDLANAGWGLAYCDEVVARHDPASVSRDHDGRRSLATRNELLTHVMRRPWGVVAMAVLDVARRSPSDPPVRRGLWEAVRRAPRALRSRHVVSADVERQLRLLERG